MTGACMISGLLTLDTGHRIEARIDCNFALPFLIKDTGGVYSRTNFRVRVLFFTRISRKYIPGFIGV